MNLDDMEDFIREKVMKDKWTHRELSDHLKQTYPSQKGFSIRSLERFCSSKDIHKTARIKENDLDIVVEDAIDKVRAATTS